MDLIAQGAISKNIVKPSFELTSTFNEYWNKIMPAGRQTSMAYPFPRLKNDGFWKRIANPGYDPNLEYNVSSMTKLREIYSGAEIDAELFQFMCQPETREQLRAILIKTYFAGEIQPVVAELGRLNMKSYEYAKTLLEEAKESMFFGEGNGEKVRDQGFRKAIVSLYDHRCALCGIRMLTPEGHTVVEAAHVVPWCQSHDDRPTNGMCLCRLCHWSFDEGLMSVGEKYQVLVSKRVQIEKNLPGHILTLTDRSIFSPDDEKFWPDQNNLQKHRKTKFAPT